MIEFLPRFFIDNFGWASADDASLNVTAASTDGRPEGTMLNVPLGSVTDSAMADVTACAQTLGLDTDYLAHNKLICTDPNDERLCLAELKQSGNFGKVADYISLEYMTVTINIQGTLDYSWAGLDGVTAQKSSPFSVVLSTASVATTRSVARAARSFP